MDPLTKLDLKNAEAISKAQPGITMAVYDEAEYPRNPFAAPLPDEEFDEFVRPLRWS